MKLSSKEFYKMLNTDFKKLNLSTNNIGQSTQYYPKLTSTNTTAWELVKENVPNGTVVITDNQTAGRGQQANKWFSLPGKSLTFSIILYPNVLPNLINLYSLLAGLAITDCLLEHNIQVRLKWPNDILIYGKKVGGILCESKIKGGLVKSLVIGIGLNINIRKEEFPIELRNTATSLLTESRKKYRIKNVLSSILNNLENRINNIQSSHHIKDWQNRCAHLNQEVTFHSADQIIKGIFTGLTQNGEAKILIDDKEQIYSSGEIDYYPI